MSDRLMMSLLNDGVLQRFKTDCLFAGTFNLVVGKVMETLPIRSTVQLKSESRS